VERDPSIAVHLRGGLRAILNLRHVQSVEEQTHGCRIKTRTDTFEVSESFAWVWAQCSPFVNADEMHRYLDEREAHA
jgi:hypothetical protein